MTPVGYSGGSAAGGGGSGPNPSDSFSIGVRLPESNLVPADALFVAFSFPESTLSPADAVAFNLLFPDSVPILDDLLLRLGVGFAETQAVPTDAPTFVLRPTYNDPDAAPSDALAKLSIAGIGDTNVVPADAFGLLRIAGLGDTNAAPADASTYLLSLSQSESNAAPSDTHRLAISGLGDSNTAPTDGRSGFAKLWGSGSAGAGVTSPANADGPNDGASATVSTAVAGSATETLTSNCGNAAGAGTIFTSVVFRGWYRLQTVLSTSTAKVVLHSSSALFTDLTIETLGAVNGDNNHLTTPFTLDVSSTLNTLAKLQSAQIQYVSTDAVAGTQPAIITADASSLELTGVL